MQVILRFWPVLVVSLLLTVRVSAQEPLTLQAAIQCALATHPLRHAAQIDVETAGYAWREARLPLNPTILITPNSYGTLGVIELLYITQPLEINGAREARTCAAAGKLETAQAQECMTEHDLTLAVATAYWNLALDQVLADIDAENVHYEEALVQDAGKQVGAGKDPNEDENLLKAEIELARARSQSARSQATVCQAQVELKTAMGSPESTPVILADKLCDVLFTLDERELSRLGLSCRPELQRDQGLITSAQGDVATACAAGRPDVFFGVGSVGWNTSPFGIFAGITLPVFDWGATRLEHQRACSALASQQAQLAVTRLGIKKDVREAIITVQSAEAQITALHDQELIPAEKLKEIAMTGYRKGEKKCLDVLDACHNLRSAQGEYYTAIATYRTALATLDWAVGMQACPSTP